MFWDSLLSTDGAGVSRAGRLCRAGSVDAGLLHMGALLLCPQSCIIYRVVEYINVDGPIRAADVII